MTVVQTCSPSLLRPGACCHDGCTEPAAVAILDSDLVEHARCQAHVPDAIAVKPLRWDAEWGPL